MMQTLVNFGSAIKADDSGRVRGYLVRFGGQDLEGDYFTILGLPLLGDGLRAGLRQAGFQVDWVRDGLAAERELRAVDYAASRNTAIA